VTASQFQGFGGLIKAAIQHKNSFDTKPRQFVQHLLLVVVDERANSAVAAVVVMAIKNAFVHGAVERCGFIFDLRVAEPYQQCDKAGGGRLAQPAPSTFMGLLVNSETGHS
jgi:hypothetical protein